MSAVTATRRQRCVRGCGAIRPLWTKTADIFAILVALSLPWSTTLVGDLRARAVVAVAPMMDWRAFLRSLKRPICVLPIALFALALVGTLWSDASWGERLYAVGPDRQAADAAVLFYHFERSARGMWVLIAFLVSCMLLMVMSWIVAFDPGARAQAGDGPSAAFS